MDHLLLHRDGIELAAVPLGGGGLEIGSAPGNGLRLHGPDVRPFHLVLRRRRHRWWAVGRGGALQLAAGRDVDAAALEPGVAVRIGAYVVEVTAERRAEPVVDATPPRERTRPLGETEHPAPGEPALILRYPGRDGRSEHRRLGSGELVLGRAESCDLVLPDPSVSARHARLLTDARGTVLEDLASLNGCWLDGRRIWAADVVPGIALRLGACTLDVLGATPAERAGARRLRPVFPPGLAAAVAALRVAAPSREPCLLLGETGSGKEVFARRLHELGPRRGGPFVPVNAAALPRELAESILFGHRRGAFTGAVEPHRGAFERAAGGTLFLDEIGEMPPELQAKLLRALEDGAVMPVGGEKAVEIDIRVVAATNRDLPASVRAGRFRLDLWHRLAVFLVSIPPLRERPGDLPALAAAILAALAGNDGPPALTDDALAVLGRHSWPGNVRELRNVLVRAAASAAGRMIDGTAVRHALDGDVLLARGDPCGSADPARLLEAHRGNVSAAARAAGMARSTFRDRLGQATGREDARP